MNCRFCNADLTHVFCDLGHQPPSNALLTREQLDEPEIYYPLKVYVCDGCWLAQLPESKKADEIFTDNYPYYSSQSPANVSHAKEYVKMIVDRFHPESVLEIGSNDGYMLNHFIDKGCRVYGVDPSEGPADEAILKGIPTLKDFFGKRVAETMLPKFDLICSINTIAHQPDINNFVEGMKIALAPEGVITAEFPHLMRLVEGVQFDTIYQEHYSYFSFSTICKIFWEHGLDVFDVDEIPEHGGSIRIYAQHETTGKQANSLKARDLSDQEYKAGMLHISYYQGFQHKVDQIRLDLVSLLIDLRAEDKMVVGYGAPAKGNTLLNYCGIRQDLVEFTVDRSPHKQDKYLPGSHIPIYNEESLKQIQPEYVLILPWNLREEIMEQLSYIHKWNGQFIIAIPDLEVL
jgi:SAM-dependent methyltransferase